MVAASPGAAVWPPKAPPAALSPFGAVPKAAPCYMAANPAAFGWQTGNTVFGAQMGTMGTPGSSYGAQFGAYYGTQSGAQCGNHHGGQ